MQTLVLRAPKLGAGALASTCACVAWGLAGGPALAWNASIALAGATLVLGLVARGRRATLALVVPSLVYLSYVLGLA